MADLVRVVRTEEAEEAGLQRIAPTPDQLINGFLDATDIRLKSKDTYRKALKSFFSFVAGSSSMDLTREKILAYKESLKSRGLSSYTISAYLSAVRRFFEYTESIKVYPNIAKGVKGAKAPRGFKKDSLTPDQVLDLLGHVDRSTIQGKRDYALLNLLVRTALRTIEIARADIGDMRQEGGDALLYIQGKGRDAKDDFVLLTEDTLRPIREYIATRGKVSDSSPLFSSLSDRNRDQRLSTRTISAIAKNNFMEIGLVSKRISAHSLRHTAITLSLKSGASIQEAQALARHSSVNTTMGYAHNIERLKNAPERRIDALLSGLQDKRSRDSRESIPSRPEEAE